MSSRRVAALLVSSGLIAAVSCGSDDDSRQQPPTAQAGDAGAPPTTAGSSFGAAPSNGGDGATAGAGAAMPEAGGAGAPASTAGQGGELPGASGGGGEVSGGASGASGAAGVGGAEADPPVFDDGFDGEQLEIGGVYSVNYVEFAQWDVASGSVDVTTLPNGFIDSPGGYGAGQLAEGVVVDLNGSTTQNGTLETKTALTFLPGVNYTLRYVLGNARNQTNAVTVSITGLVSETRTQNSVTSFTAYETTFKPLSQVTAKLVFESVGGGDDDGLLLDNVSIRR